MPTEDALTLRTGVINFELVLKDIEAAGVIMETCDDLVAAGEYSPSFAP